MDNTLNNTLPEPTSEERLLALLAHLSIFLGGILLPIILWATQKDKSKFVKFHSLQAIFYHLAFLVIIVVYIIFVAVLLVISGISLAGLADSGGNGEMPGIMIVMMIVLYGGIFVLVFGFIGYAIYVGVKAYQGKLIRIPFIGNPVYKSVYGNN